MRRTPMLVAIASTPELLGRQSLNRMRSLWETLDGPRDHLGLGMSVHALP
jgi:hypothetical protein